MRAVERIFDRTEEIFARADPGAHPVLPRRDRDGRGAERGARAVTSL
jgi:hypothetical protein